MNPNRWNHKSNSAPTATTYDIVATATAAMLMLLCLLFVLLPIPLNTGNPHSANGGNAPSWRARARERGNKRSAGEKMRNFYPLSAHPSTSLVTPVRPPAMIAPPAHQPLSRAA
eukprot:2077537-Pyramimonas_sp.AAC.1